MAAYRWVYNQVPCGPTANQQPHEWHCHRHLWGRPATKQRTVLIHITSTSMLLMQDLKLQVDKTLQIKYTSSVALAVDSMTSCPALSTPLYIFVCGNRVNETTSTALQHNQTNGEKTNIKLEECCHATDHLILIHRRMVVPQSIYWDMTIFFG